MTCPTVLALARKAQTRLDESDYRGDTSHHQGEALVQDMLDLLGARIDGTTRSDVRQPERPR